MSVAATSRWAYETVDVGARQKDVADALRELGEASDAEIAGHLGWTINRVTPRRGELVDQALVTACGQKEGPYGCKVNVWRLVLAQGDLFDAMKRKGEAA
jgi:hypothetical protein